MQLNYTSKDIERFWSKIDKSGGENSCWIWTASCNKTGYGQIKWNNTTYFAHRVVWILIYKEIPDNFDVHQDCGNYLCCNPSHLSLITQYDKDVSRFWSKVSKSDNPDACWIWTGSTTNGYGQIGWGRGSKKELSHRISWILSFGDIPNNLHVLHRCDNPPCCNPSHLFLGTDQDNVNDRERKGRNNPPRGEKNGMHKLTNSQVAEIRQRYKRKARWSNQGESSETLAKIFGVSSVLIRLIVRYKVRT